MPRSLNSSPRSFDDVQSVDCKPLLDSGLAAKPDTPCVDSTPVAVQDVLLERLGCSDTPVNNIR